MSYAQRRAIHGFRLVGEFTRDKVRKDVRPDMVYEQYRYAKREYKNIDAWLITMWDNKCLMAIHEYDYIHQIIVGSLKLRVRLFGGDRNKVSSYKEWRQYSDAGLRDPETKISAGMLDIANAIIAALEPPT